MPRGPRQKSETGFYHIYQRGNDKQIIFEDDGDRRKYLSLLQEALERFEVRLIAWCLMTNHVHLLIDDPKDHIAETLHRLGTLYAKYFSKRWSRVGHVFQGRFGSQPIKDEAHLLEAFRYIHNNPPLGRLAPAEEYRWSSYKEYTGAARHKLCDTAMMLEMLDGADGFRSFVAERSPVGYYYEGGGKLNDDQAKTVAEYIMGGRGIDTLKRLRPADRKPYVIAILQAGVRVCQLERMSGLSRSALYAS